MFAQHTHRIGQRGFSLVEVMVGMAIGLITVLVIMQTLATSEAQRRASTSSSDSNVTGALSLQVMQRDLLNAGFGLAVDTNLYSICGGGPVLAYNSQRSTPDISLDASVFTPVQIFPATAPGPYPAPDANTDIVQITYSGSNTFIGRGINVGSASATATDFVTTSEGSRAGLRMGDMIVAVPCSTIPSGSTCTPVAASSCILALVTDMPMSSGTNNECGVAAVGGDTDRQIRHATGNFLNPYEGCGSRTNVWSKAGAANLGQSFAGGKLYSLGPPDRVAIRAYAVRGGRLTACSPLYQDCDVAAEWQTVGENIVSLRAEFGYDADGDGAVAAGEWVRVLPANNWLSLKTVRIALVGRGREIAKDAIGGANCTPAWAGLASASSDCSAAAVDGEIFLSSAPDGANWARYRYKVFETTVPLRNLFWSDN